TEGLSTADVGAFRGRMAMAGALENRAWGAFVRVEALVRTDDVAADSLAYAFRQILQVPLWVPWLALGALQLAVIGGLWWFAHPTISWLLAPAVRAMAGEDALHYPNLFRWLPELYGRFDLVVGALAGAVVTGQSTALFAAWFSGQPLRPEEGMRRGVSRAGALILANLPLTLLVLGLSSVFNGWLEHRQGPALLIRVAPLVTLG